MLFRSSIKRVREGRMSIVEPVIRPPAEADSFLLQVTLGCSVDSCSFCGAYKSKTFSVKDRKEITADIN